MTRTRSLLAGMLTVASLATSTASAQEPEAQPAAAADEMPDALPPIDDDLADLLGAEAEAPEPQPMLAGISLLGHGRLRFELDESRDRLPVNDLQTGVVMTGRLGMSAPIGPHRARVVLGDGRRFGQDFGLLPQRNASVALGFLYSIRLDVDVQALFVPVTLSVGRYPFKVADHRWVGTAPFSARGRTFDGAHVSWRSDLVDVTAGLFYLGPYLAGDVAETSFFGTLEVARSADWYDLSVYALGHRDGTPARAGQASVAASTLGSRFNMSAFGATLALGADGQLPVLDNNPLAPAGWGAHLDARARYAPEFLDMGAAGTPFIELAGEWTGGAPVYGRRFRQPGASNHRFLGLLDVAIADNVTSADLRLGIATAAGLLVEVDARLFFLSDPTGPMLDPTGRALIAADPERSERFALTEVDARVRIPIAPGARIDGKYGVGVPGPAFAGGSTPIQRLLIAVIFDLDTGS
jgi:hypothetical protein